MALMGLKYAICSILIRLFKSYAVFLCNVQVKSAVVSPNSGNTLYLPH